MPKVSAVFGVVAAFCLSFVGWVGVVVASVSVLGSATCFVGCFFGVGAQQLSFSGRQRLFEDQSAFGLVVIVHQWRV